MPAPVTVTIDVPQPRRAVWDHLDVLANHEAFTDHVLADWELSGPPRGVGAKVRVTSTAGPRPEAIDIEVVEVQAPARSVERNRGASGRVATGTYELSETAGGGTLVAFTYAWEQAPLPERLLAPVVRRLVRRANERALARLAEVLAAQPQAG